MKYIPYLYIGAFTFLIACSSEERITTTNGNDKTSDAIELSAGIAVGNSKAITRTGVEDNHANHKTFTSGTKIALRISGTWIGHGTGTVIQTTTATVGDATGADNRHNALTCNPVRYWEDYGTSDINNTAGRTEGLTIYGAAVNNKSLSAASINELITTDALWNAIPWVLDADQTASNKTPTDKDLLISNNVKADTDDGTYKFDSHTSGKLLEFKHAMSKITVNLKPGAGFTSGFNSTPEVILTSRDGTAETTSTPYWALITGKVNVFDGAVDITSEGQGTPSTITMCNASLATTANEAGYTVAKEALVMPGSQFTADNAIIARINADNNIYYVTAANIRDAMHTANNSTNYKTEAGKNYIINVQVNQTDVSVRVTATVANWTDVSAEEVAPVINVNANWGDGSTAFSKDEYSLFRSTALADGYGTEDANHYFKEERRVKKSGDNWIMSEYVTSAWQASPIYWPNHNTHYQFRGVWPAAGSATGSIETGAVNYPRVESSTHSGTPQVIKVSNVAYIANRFPSDLMIARPEIHDNGGNIDNTKTCNNSDHESVSLYDVGICATEGTINLNFRYMMSQVEVNLSTKDNPSDPDYVNLTNAKVEIVNVNNTGDVTLGNREVIPTGDKGPYTIDYVSGNNYHSAIVPQELTYTTALASGNVKFRITIYNNGDTNSIDDIYYADINPILKQSSSDKVAPSGKWESGVHYVYNLRLTKTNVQVTASLTNWTTVNADHTVWF